MPLLIHEKGELEHQRVKRYYKRTNKYRFQRQIAKHEQMERHYRKYIDALQRKTCGQKVSQHSSSNTEGASPRQHYSVAHEDRSHVDLYTLSTKYIGDPALKVHNTTHHQSFLH